MEEVNVPRHERTIDVPVRVFSERLGALTQAQSGGSASGHSASSSVYSRLALIHQVAKALATEAVSASGRTPVDLTVDELTDPPLYESGPDDEEPVVIRFSYG